MTSTNAVVRLLIADPHPVVVAGIRMFLQADKTVRVVGECKELWQLGQRCEELAPDVVLLGHDLDENGWAAVSQVYAERKVKCVSLLLSAERSLHTLTQALRGGCRGVFCKTDPLDELSKAIHAVYGGQMWFRDTDTHRLLESLLDKDRAPSKQAGLGGQLTERQQQIVTLVARGSTNLEIAEAIRVSQATVALDLTQIYKKLGVPDRVRLLIKVRETKFMAPYPELQPRAMHPLMMPGSAARPN